MDFRRFDGPVNCSKGGRIGVLCATLIALWAIFTVLITVVQLLPRGVIEQHASEALYDEALLKVFDYNETVGGTSVSYDNNRFIVAVATQKQYSNPLETAIRASIETAYPTGDRVSYDYYRYWHGWQVLTSFCLLFPHSMLLLKVILFVMATSSTVLLFVGIKRYMHPLSATVFIAIAFFMTGIYFSFIGDLLLSLSTSAIAFICYAILALKAPNSNYRLFKISWLCVIAGAVYNWLDFLAIIPFAFGIVLFCSLLSVSDNCDSLIELLMAALSFGLCLLAGYCLTWMFKWALASLYEPAGYILADVAQETARWSLTSANSDIIISEHPGLFAASPALYAIWITLRGVFAFAGHTNKAGYLGAAITILFVVAALTVLFYNHREDREELITSGSAGTHTCRVAVLLPALLPVAYCVIMSNHAIVHIWLFSSKSWSITFAIVAMVCCEYLVEYFENREVHG